MKHRTLLDHMTEAARLATEQAIARGHRRDSEVVRKSAFVAAEEVHRREAPQDFIEPHPPEDPVRERMERE